MANRGVEGVAPQLRSLLVLGATSGLADGQLVARFAGGEGEAARLAFEVLVGRHGPMVLRVCRGVLRDPHAAEDAFQATFLVLARRAGSIRERDSVASWLHGVALRVAGHARADEARRRRLERAAAGRPAAHAEVEPGDDLGARLLEEIGRLPERDRAAVVLCDLEGRTSEEAARALGWPVGTVKSRLSRARGRLRDRLTRLGLAPGAPFGFPGLAPLPPRLATVTAQAAARVGSGLVPSAASSAAFAMAEGVWKAMILSKLKWAGLALLAPATLTIAPALAPARPAQDPPKAEARVTVGPKPEAKSPAPDPVALMVPRSLSAVGGVGLALMYALEPKGDRIPDPTTGGFREVEVGLRWVAITGLLDDQAVREASTLAGEAGPFVGGPDYLRVDVERQVRGPDGGWSDWSRIDVDKNYELLDNLPEVTPERLPKAVLPLALVDTLPVLRQGRWDGVDPEGLLGLIAPGTEQDPAGGVAVAQQPRLAVRSLDFTVEPGKTYRYRLRVVTRTPVVPRLVPRDDEIHPGDRQGVVPPAERPSLVSGPWSEATGAVEVP